MTCKLEQRVIRKITLRIVPFIKTFGLSAMARKASANSALAQPKIH